MIYLYLVINMNISGCKQVKIWLVRKCRYNKQTGIGITTDSELLYDSHVLNIYSKANKKLSVLCRLSIYKLRLHVIFRQWRMLIKSLLEAQFNYSLTKVNYTLSILQIYWKYTSEVYLQHTSSILEVTSSILQSEELQKYTSSLYYFDKRSTFEAHFKAF